MASNLPPHLKSAFDHLSSSIHAAEKRPVDLLHAPWAEVEKSVIKVLGGAFAIDNPEHQAVALGLAAALGERLAETDKAFWFPNREAPEAAMVGFPEALLMLSPFGAAADALGRGNLSMLDTVMANVRSSLSQSKFSIASGQAPRLGPDEYRRIFDAGFVQITRVDPARVKTLFESRTDSLIRDFRDAVSKAAELPQEARAQFEEQVVGSLKRLDPAKTLSEQVAQAPRLMELLIHLFATVGSTGAAPEEFWYDVVTPLLLIGAPGQFPPLDAQEVEAAKKGADPLALFLDVVPYQQTAHEDGLLGLFGQEDISLPHKDLASGNVPPRTLSVSRAKVEELTRSFDPQASADVISKFTAELAQKVGQPIKPTDAAQQMTKAALTLLADVKRLAQEAAKDGGALYLRRLTEAEGTSEPVLQVVRKALQGPRIILTAR
jgi:hypothetical protein